ncbi:tRNA (guanine-N(7)-)-methyltransferase domain protein [[Clostridium] sordellii ATCC 9714]|nr:tRNA (guanine-N(7)-)-methyltransferase domain protein [[Clostridium] sordellii ATCC 9714] [Paeniclostridium sordellii ATCC 9714]
MRRRKKKGADLKLLSFENLVLKGDEIDFKGNWNEKFQNDNPIHVEFGQEEVNF